jgi:hypothetical protein
MEIEDIKNEINLIKERNKRVEADFSYQRNLYRLLKNGGLINI